MTLLVMLLYYWLMHSQKTLSLGTYVEYIAKLQSITRFLAARSHLNKKRHEVHVI